MKVAVNGKAQKINPTPSSYVVLHGPWKNGDTVDITLPMHLHSEAMSDDPNKIAILYGPVVLAGQLGEAGINAPMPYATGDQFAYSGVSDPHVPVLLTDGKPLDTWVKPMAGQPLTFQTVGVGRPNDVTLKPFNTTYFSRYTIYWDTFTPEGWKQREAKYQAERDRQQALEARTVDRMGIGEQQPEVDHKLQSERSSSGPLGEKRWRDAADGGWFSFTLKVLPDAAQDLVCTYWGGETGNRVFDVLVDGTKVASQTLNQDKPGQFFDVTTPLPAALLTGKTVITVRFQAKPGSMAGGLFGCRIVKRA